MRPCFAFSAAADKGQPETLDLLDEIGFWGTQAKDFSDRLKAVQTDSLNVNISSPGGDVFAGLAMYNMLRDSKKTINVKVLGIAASAASLVAMAGDTRTMPKNTMMMVHNPWTISAGNADQFRDTADTLDKIGNSLLGIYVSRAGIDEAEMKAMLATDTYLTADEALAAGLATEVVDEIKVSAKFDLARADLPENVKKILGLSPVAVVEQTDEEKAAEQAARDQAAAEEAAALAAANPISQQINDLAIKASLPEFANTWAVSCSEIKDVEERIVRAREIKSICAFAKMPDAAAAFINANKSVAEARASIVAAMVKADGESVIDTTPRNKQTKQTTGQSGAPKVINTASIWASHNAQTLKKGS